MKEASVGINPKQLEIINGSGSTGKNEPQLLFKRNYSRQPDTIKIDRSVKPAKSKAHDYSRFGGNADKSRDDITPNEIGGDLRMNFRAKSNQKPIKSSKVN